MKNDIKGKTGNTINYYMEKGRPVTKIVMGKFPILGILTIIFVIAKIFDKLDWSWFMVFWPLWLVPAIILSVIGLIIGGIICMIIYWLLEDLWKWAKRKLKKYKSKKKNCC